ncbi:hypothetical protein KAT95_01705 [Candidatus Parcubacteria bacterium]|nr:hypothetical protein [Candidatus Parcubacteria bacterium]
MGEFENRIEEINSLYAKAVGGEEYVSIMEKTNKLEEDMKEGGKSVEEIAEGIYNGFFGEYYWVRKFFTTDRHISMLKESVGEYYQQIKEPSLKVKYGYLLTVIVSELEENFDEARRIEKEIREIASKTGNTASIFREINARGLRKMKESDFSGAVKVFNEINDFEEISREDFRHAGNIVNNRGAARIRGNIDIIDGARDLLLAADYYLQEEEPSRGHLGGLRNRLREVMEKL